ALALPRLELGEEAAHIAADQAQAVQLWREAGPHDRPGIERRTGIVVDDLLDRRDRVVARPDAPSDVRHPRVEWCRGFGFPRISLDIRPLPPDPRVPVVRRLTTDFRLVAALAACVLPRRRSTQCRPERRRSLEAP